MGAIFPYSTAYESRESPKNAIIKTSLKKKKQNYKKHGFLHHNHDTIHMALSENMAPCSVQWLIIMFLVKIVTWGIHAISRHSHITRLVLNRNWM